MKSYIRRVVAEIGATDVLTYMFPYETRILARQSRQDG